MIVHQVSLLFVVTNEKRRSLCIMKAVYKTLMGTLGCVCGDLGLGDMRGGMWGHQSWDARTSGTGTRGYLH